MEKKDIVNNLQILGRLHIGGEPSALWISDSREQLLRSVREDAASRPLSDASPRIRTIRGIFGIRDAMRLVFQTSGVLAASASLLFGSVAGASAMYGSVPGDTLYPLKRVSERAQIALTTKPEARARLQVDFLGRRVQEVTRLNEKPFKETARINEAVKELRAGATSVEQEIVSLKKESPSDAVQVAQYVDQKSDEYQAALSAPIADRAIREAKDIVVDASVKAVAVIIDGRARGETIVPEEEVVSSVGEKIAAVSARVVSIEESLSSETPSSVKSSASEAKEALTEAKSLVDKQDLTAALVKVIEGKTLVNAAESIAHAQREAAALVSTTSTLPGSVVVPGTGTVLTGIATSSFPKFVSSTPASVSDVTTQNP